MSGRPDSSWMPAARWGVFFHFLADVASTRATTGMTVDVWNARVDAFDVDRLAGQLSNCGAKVFGITLGQNSGFYCAPNETYDRLTGLRPSKLSRRDLVGDLIVALRSRDIRLIVYCPSHAPALDPEAVTALACTPRWNADMWSMSSAQYGDSFAGRVDERLSVFQRNWEAILTEWSQRWGEGVHAWWIDGVYFGPRMYEHADAPNFTSFAGAMRAGNGSALVSFNEGIRRPRLESYPASGRDFLAGEADFCLPVNGRWYDGSPVWNADGHVGGERLFAFTFLGQFWGQGPLRFPDMLAAGYTQHVNASGGMMLWDVPMQFDGTLDDATMRQLKFVDRQLVRVGPSAIGG